MTATLHMAPYTCARVTAIALEEAGMDFDLAPVRFVRGEHKSPAYRALNPLGKVPALEIDGLVLTENLAILVYLDERFPDAGLLPEAHSPADRARILADLAFCSATLHPLVTRIRMPAFFAGAEHAATVKSIAESVLDDYFAVVEGRLVQADWWYGERWSAMDAYLYWIFWRVEGAGYDVKRYSRFVAHARRMEERPSVRAVLAREEDMQAQLVAEGAAFIPPKA